MKSNQYIDGTYFEKVKDWHANDAPWKASKVIQMIKNHHLTYSSVCDIGCGTGQILVELQKKMEAEVELTGFDISPQAISVAKQKENHKLTFHNEDFLAAKPPLSDLLLLLDVFEHIPNYIDFLDAIREKTDWIIFHIPLDIGVKGVIRKSSWMLYMRERYGHLHYFTKETAIATISDIGYNIMDYFYTDDYEISKIMIPVQLRPRLVYEVRKRLFHINQDFAASLFEHYNLMLLARGDRGKL